MAENLSTLIPIIKILLPVTIYYFMVKRDIKKSALFSVILYGLATIFISLFTTFGWSNLVDVGNNLLFFIAILVGVVLLMVYSSFYLMGEKTDIKIVLSVASVYAGALLVLAYIEGALLNLMSII